MKRSVLRQLKTKRQEVVSSAEVGMDCALFSVDSKSGAADLCSCMQEAAVVSEAERFGSKKQYAVTMPQLIQRCANNLAAGGGSIFAVEICLLLPEGTEEPEVRTLMQEAESACKELQIQIAGGQTRITEAVTSPIAVITGLGHVVLQKAKKPAPGMDVVISKWIGLEGTAQLAGRFREDIITRYPQYLVDEAALFERYRSVLPEAATAVKSGVCMMHDLSEGGVFASLWELAQRAGVGLTIDLKKIPLRQETVEVCEFCGVNPYELLSGGSLLMLTEDGPGLVLTLEEAGIPASIIGKVTDSNDKIILNEDEVRYMDRPKRDALFGCLESFES